MEVTFLEVVNTPKTSKICLIQVALHNSPHRTRKRANERELEQPWGVLGIEVQLQFNASIGRIEMDSRRRVSRRHVSGPSLAVAEMMWAEPMQRLDIHGGRGRETSSAYLKLEKMEWPVLATCVEG